MAEPYTTKKLIQVFDTVWERVSEREREREREIEVEREMESGFASVVLLTEREREEEVEREREAEREAPVASLLLGNHDFFDKCESFRELCVARGRLGPWRIGNGRSSGFVQRIATWVFVGVTFNQLDDLQQAEVSRILAQIRRVEADAKEPQLDFVLIGHRPFWLLDEEELRAVRQPNLHGLLTFLRQGPGRALRLCLAGDLHNFSHHIVPENEGGGETHYMVSGGGGAFLHPPGRRIRRDRRKGGDIEPRFTYPDARTTWWIRFTGSILMPIRQPFLTVLVCVAKIASTHIGISLGGALTDLDEVQLVALLLILFAVCRACVSRQFRTRQLPVASAVHEFLVTAACIVIALSCALVLFWKGFRRIPFLYRWWKIAFALRWTIADLARPIAWIWALNGIVLALATAAVAYSVLMFALLMIDNLYTIVVVGTCTANAVWIIGCAVSETCSFTLMRNETASAASVPQNTNYVHDIGHGEMSAGAMVPFVVIYAILAVVYPYTEKVRQEFRAFAKFIGYPCEVVAEPFLATLRFHWPSFVVLGVVSVLVGGFFTLWFLVPSTYGREEMFTPFYLVLWLFRTYVYYPWKKFDIRLAIVLGCADEEARATGRSLSLLARHVVLSTLLVSVVSVLFACVWPRWSDPRSHVSRSIDEGFFASLRISNYKNFLKMKVDVKGDLQVDLMYKDVTDDQGDWSRRPVHDFAPSARLASTVHQAVPAPRSAAVRDTLP
jgi:hypothetical protein